MDLTPHQKAIKEAVLAGYDTPSALAEYLFTASKVDAELRADLLASLKRLLSNVEFNSIVQQAREDVVGTCLESFKETAMKNVLQMKDMAENSTDERVKYSANKDILDRVGLKPVEKQVSYAPADYLRLVEGLTKKAKDAVDAADLGLGPSEVVPAPEVHPEGEPEGDGRRA